jgi:uncharacterized protein YbjT (DUF2867 family)
LSISCVIGATRGTGLLIAKRLAADGKRVRVVARDVAKARAIHGDSVEVVPGDVCDRASLNQALVGDLDTIFFTVEATGGIAGRALLGSRHRIRSVTYDGLVNCVDEARTRCFSGRFVMASVIGCDRRSFMWWALNLLKPGLKKNVEAREHYLKASGLNHIILRAPVLTNGQSEAERVAIRPAARRFTIGARLAREDYARVMVFCANEAATAGGVFDVFRNDAP